MHKLTISRLKKIIAEEVSLLKEGEKEDQAAANKDWPADCEINGYKLVLTCPACPEQYDVFKQDGKKAGYLRLRHGTFRADAPCPGGHTVYSSLPKGQGMFDDNERKMELTNAVVAIQTWWETTQSNTRK
jgi:hypothetical protein